MKKILSIGDIIWDVYPDKAVIGGASFNFAAHVSLCRQNSFLFSAVGKDSLGDDALLELARFNISDKYIQRNGYPTGQCIVTLDENKIPSFRVAENAAYDYLNLSAPVFEELKNESFDAVYYGTLSERHPVSRAVIQNLISSLPCGIRFCDINLRKNCYDRDTVEFNMSHASILKISDEEEPLIRGFGFYPENVSSHREITEAISNAFPNIRVILLTLGAEGSFAYDCVSKESYFQPAVKVEAVSTVGAGDSYSAAWLSSYLDGREIPSCMKKAAEISAFVVAHTEAVPIY